MDFPAEPEPPNPNVRKPEPDTPNQNVRRPEPERPAPDQRYQSAIPPTEQMPMHGPIGGTYPTQIVNKPQTINERGPQGKGHIYASEFVHPQVQGHVQGLSHVEGHGYPQTRPPVQTGEPALTADLLPPPLGMAPAVNVVATGEQNYRPQNLPHPQIPYNKLPPQNPPPLPPPNPAGGNRGHYAGEGYPPPLTISDIRPMPGVDYIPQPVVYDNPGSVAPPIQGRGFIPQTLIGGAGVMSGGPPRVMSGGPPPIMYIYIYIYIVESRKFL